jgi:hypothetical protein
VRDRVESAIAAARLRVDSAENEAMPRCELEPTAIDAGDVLYCERRELRVALRNVGLVSAPLHADAVFMPMLYSCRRCAHTGAVLMQGVEGLRRSCK